MSLVLASMRRPLGVNRGTAVDQQPFENPLRHASIRTLGWAALAARCTLGSEPARRCNLCCEFSNSSEYSQSPGRGGSWFLVWGAELWHCTSNLFFSFICSLALVKPTIALCRIPKVRKPPPSPIADASALPSSEQRRHMLACARSFHRVSLAPIPSASSRCPSRRDRACNWRTEPAAFSRMDRPLS